LKTSAKHIADRIRLLIATKQFQVDELLPSTRELGQQLDVNFHTVRKAYQMLQKEGLVEAHQGKGFMVSRQMSPLDKSARLDTGADQMRTLLEELIGYGLNEEEIEVIFEEQLNYVEWPDRLQSVATVGLTLEHAEMLSAAIKRQVGVKSDFITADEEEKIVNYDALFVPVQMISELKTQYQILQIPIVYQYEPALLVNIAELAGSYTLGLVCRDEQTVPVIIEELKTVLGYSGSIIGGTIYGKSLPLFVRDVDLVLYPPETASLVERQLPDRKRVGLQYSIAEYSTNQIRSELWDQ